MTVFVPGEPQPKGSTRAFVNKRTGRANVTNDNADTKPWQATVASFVRDNIGSAIPIPEGQVWIGLEFVMPRRKAEPKRVTPAHTRKPDVDKLARAILDSLTGLIYADDAQVVGFTRLFKRTAEIGEQPGVHIEWEA